jgi:hypothetical protein
VRSPQSSKMASKKIQNGRHKIQNGQPLIYKMTVHKLASCPHDFPNHRDKTY